MKHVGGEPAAIHFLRQTAEQGRGDVTFTDRRGRLSEVSI